MFLFYNIRIEPSVLIRGVQLLRSMKKQCSTPVVIAHRDILL